MLQGPPGHPDVPPLPAPLPDVDVRRRRVRPVPDDVRHATRVVSEALFSADGEAPNEERLAWLVDDFGDFYARSHGNARLILRMSLFVLTWIAPLFAFVPMPLGSLSIRRRVIALERLEASPLAPAALAVKAMLCILWFEHPATQAETGTAPTCMGRRP